MAVLPLSSTPVITPSTGGELIHKFPKENSDSVLELDPQSQVLIKRKTTGIFNTINPENNNNINSQSSSNQPLINASENIGIITVPLGSRLQYQLQNQGEFPVYFLVFSMNSEGETYIFNSGFDPQQQQIAPGKSLSLPTANIYSGNSSTEMIGEMVKGSTGLVETHVILSHNPFLETLEISDRNINKNEGILKFNRVPC